MSIFLGGLAIGWAIFALLDRIKYGYEAVPTNADLIISAIFLSASIVVYQINRLQND